MLGGDGMTQSILTTYFIFINVYGLMIMRRDKKRARAKSWRVPERHLWLIAFFGGAFGMTVGMRIVRHKTNHFQFKYGLPLLTIVELIVYIYLFTLLS